jgi:hypothetical protein
MELVISYFRVGKLQKIIHKYAELLVAMTTIRKCIQMFMTFNHKQILSSALSSS